MKKAAPLVVFDSVDEKNALVLTIASPAKNSVTEIYSERVQISLSAIEDLNRKLLEKLYSHRVTHVRSVFSIRYANDRIVSLDSAAALAKLDDRVPHLTELVTAQWSFVIDPSGDGDEHMHSVMVRMSERPNPALIFQRMASGRPEDLDSLDTDAFAPICCKIDFLEGRFSSELLALVAEWTRSLPKAVPTFGLVRFLRRHSDGVTEYIHGTFPPLVVVAALGVWMAYLPTSMTSSVKFAVAWILLSGVAFLLGRYFARRINNLIERSLQRISSVPVFQITAGDKNRMTEYLAKSHKSMWRLAAGGLVFGVFKGIGLYLAGVLIARLFA